MAAHAKGSRTGPGAGNVGNGDAFLSYLYPFSNLSFFKTLPQPQFHLKDQLNKLNTSVPQQRSLTATYDLPPGLEKDSVALFEGLWELGISTETVKYVPKKDRDINDSTIYCKNLFLKDRKGKFYLVICEEDESVNLKSLRQKLKAYRNFSFASAEEVSAILGVREGEITPLALQKDTDGKVRVAVMRSLCTHGKLNFHPLDKRYATRISFQDLDKFLAKCGHTIEVLTP